MLSILELFMLSVALGADLFSVTVPIGMTCVRRRVILYAAVVFALFHIVMILVGYHAGLWLGSFVEHLGTYHFDCPAFVENAAHAVGALVLAGLGLQMIWDTIKGDAPISTGGHALQGMPLMVVAVGVSVDALAAGFSLGMLDVDLWRLSMILGAVIFIIAVAGLGLGKKICGYTGDKAGCIGGSVLVALAVHLFYSFFF